MNFTVFQKGGGDTGSVGQGNIIQAIDKLNEAPMEVEAVLYYKGAPIATKPAGQASLNERDRSKLIKEFWGGEK